MADQPTLTYATATWCMPCKQLKPKVREECDRAGVRYVEIDIDTPEAEGMDIHGVPSIAFGDTPMQTVATWPWPKIREAIQDMSTQGDA